MDTRTGQIVSSEILKTFPTAEQEHFIEVKRDLTAKEIFDKQIGLYALCGCGSGKKFKFCCKK